MVGLVYLSFPFYRLSLESESKQIEQQNCAGLQTAISSKKEIIQNNHCEQLYKFEIKQEQEESSINTPSLSSGIKFNSLQFELDAPNKIKSLKRKCPGPEFLEHSVPKSTALSTFATQHSEDAGSIYSQTAEAPENNGTVNDHDQQTSRYMRQDQHIDGKSNIHTSMSCLMIPEPSTFTSQKHISNSTSSYTYPLEGIIIGRAISPKKEPIDEFETPNARDNDENCRSKTRYGHEAPCGIKGHTNFEIENILNVIELLKDEAAEIECIYYQASEFSPDERIQSINNPDTSYIKQPIPLEHLEAHNKYSVKTEDAVQDVVAKFNLSDIKKKQDGANDAVKNDQSINSIPLTDTLSSSKKNTLDQENFLLTTKMIFLLHKDFPEFRLFRLIIGEVTLRNRKKSNIYKKCHALTKHPKMPKAYKIGTTFFLFGLFFRYPMYRKVSGLTTIIIPMKYQGFYQYNHLFIPESNIISKYDGYIIMTVEIKCSETGIASIEGVRGRFRIQIAVPADEKYRDFLKEFILIKHGGQRLMIEYKFIVGNQLRFIVYWPPEGETLERRLQASSCISRSKRFIPQVKFKQVKSTHFGSKTSTEPFDPLDAEVLTPLMKETGQINNLSINNEFSNNVNSAMVEKTSVIRDGKEGSSEHHNHSILLTSSGKVLSDQEMRVLLKENFLLTREAVDRLRKIRSNRYLFKLFLEELCDKTGMKMGFYDNIEHLNEYPRCWSPVQVRNMFVLYALFPGYPPDVYNIGNTALIMPMIYQGFVQYNRCCQLRSGVIYKFDNHFVINFNITFIEQRLPIIQKRKRRAVLIIRADKEHTDFLKDAFFIMHAGQMLFMYLKRIRNHELWFSIYKAPSFATLRIRLENSLIIYQSQKYKNYEKGGSNN